MLRRIRVGSVLSLLGCTAALCVAAFLGAGCEEEPVIPPELAEVDSDDAADSAPEAPTTQELLSGPRKTIPLGTLPLKIEVPTSWGIKTLDNTSITLLEGFAPSGLVQIQLARRPFLRRDKFEGNITRARKEQSEKSDTIKVLDVRPMPGVAGGQVLERQSVGQTIPPMPIDPEGKQLTRPETIYSWTLTYFIPQADGYEVFELNFVGLTAEQFEADKALLREIIDSVSYSGAATGIAATAPATAP